MGGMSTGGTKPRMQADGRAGETVGGALTAMALTGGAGVAAAWFGWSKEGVLLATLGVGVGSAVWFILRPRREAAARYETLRREAERALAGAETAERVGPLAESVGGSLDTLGKVIRGLGGGLPEARARAAEAERARLMAEAVVDAVPTAVFATDASGRIRVGNKEAEAFFDVTGLVGKHIGEVFTQRDALDLHRSGSRGRAGRDEIRWVQGGQTRIIELAASPWPGVREGEQEAARWGVVIAAQDVTARAEAERLRTDFVANASHELRTPLAAIKGAVETLEGGAEEEPAMRGRLLRMIADNAVRLEDLTRDLLDLSRLEGTSTPVSVRRVDPSEIEGSLRAHFAATLAERPVGLVFAWGAGLVSDGGILTDERLLMLILRNLVENALKFAQERTDVVVGAERVSDEEGEPIVRWRVTDKGIGIPYEQQSRIFERFYQVDGSRAGNGPKGTGLGLAIVRHAVKSLGGAIRVESVWKQGTTMIVDLPEPIETA
jgi:two-component system phosphate regulon sensor histidine kinase PhoR